MKIDKPFMKINEAAKVTGLSTYYIRDEIVDGVAVFVSLDD